MKFSNFGDPQPEPDDDLTEVFNEAHGNSDGLESEGDSFENCDWLGGWTASVRNEDGDEMTVRGFDTREALVAYLKSHSVTIY